jgi:putative Mn2+ efflux pump MntP
LEIAGYILIAFALSATGFSVALNTSIFRCLRLGESILIAFTFGFSDVLMFAIGWLLGHSMLNMMMELSWPIGILLFLFIGIRMILESRKTQADRRTMAVKNIRLLLGFALVTGTNAFVIGIASGLVMTNLFYLAGSLLIISIFMVMLGVWLGKHGMLHAWKKVELSGGILLILTGVYLVIQLVKMH